MKHYWIDKIEELEAKNKKLIEALEAIKQKVKSPAGNYNSPVYNIADQAIEENT